MRDHERDQFNSTERALASFIADSRLVIVGIGNRDRGDDGFGPAVIDTLQEKVSAVLIDGGCCPENFVHRITVARPDVVIFLDAADMNQPPGELAFVAPDELAGGGLSSHAGNIAIVAEYVTAISGARCGFILAQPADMGPMTNGQVPTGEPPNGPSTDPSSQAALSPAIVRAVHKTGRILKHLAGYHRAPEACRSSCSVTPNC